MYEKILEKEKKIKNSALPITDLNNFKKDYKKLDE